MKQYETYKDSGAEWIGEIPESWKSVNLKWISNITKGKKPKVDFDENGENLLPYLSMEFLRGKTSNPTYASIEEKGLVHIDDGDILILWDGSKAGEIVKAKKGILSSTMAKIEINDNNFESNYLNYLLQLGERHVQEHTIGMGIPHVSGDILKMLPMLVPSPQEQTQIATYLDFKTGLIDSIISQKEDLIKKLKEQRQAIINEAVTKGLNKDVKLKDSGIEWLGDIPEHWEGMTFRRVSHLQQGLQIPISERFYEEVDGALEYITTKSIHNPNDFRQYIVGAKESVICSEDDVLLGRTGNTGEVVTGVKGVFHNNFFKIDFDKTRIEKNFIVYFLKTTLIQELIMLVAGTTTIPDLNHGDFLNLPFVLPPLEEQKSLLKILEAGLLVNDKCNKATIDSIQKLKEYRQSLISEAVTGKVDVRNWQAPKS